MGKTFSTGNLTNGVFQDTSNNIGIGGAPSGSYKLDVTGTGRYTGNLTLTGSYADLQNTTYIRFSNSGGGTRWGYIQHNGTDIGFNNDISGGKFTFTGGNVGIGTSSPTDSSGFGRILDLNGTTASAYYTRYNGSSTIYALFGQDSGTTYLLTKSTPLSFYVNNAERMRITSDGNVGIGTTNAVYPLVVKVATNRNWAISASGSGFASFRAGDDGYNNFNRGEIDALPLLLNSQSGGNVFIGTTTNSGFSSYHRITVLGGVAEGANFLSIDGGTEYSSLCKAVSQSGYNGSNAAQLIGRNSSTGRSINAGGTINASGADYAEYMTKAIEDTINKGDIVGVDENGLLTNIFENAKSFVVKSTDPSYVGGDSWGNIDIIGKKIIDGTDKEKELLNIKLEEARAKVDRIAFSGQVPCNVYNAQVGDYIIPIELNNKISGQAVTNPTFEQYKISVGKVWRIMEDGRAWIAVKIG